MLQGIQQNSVDVMSYAQPQAEAAKQKEAVGEASTIKPVSSDAQAAKTPDAGPAYTLEISEEAVQAQQTELKSGAAQPAAGGQPPAGGQAPAAGQATAGEQTNASALDSTKATVESMSTSSSSDDEDDEDVNTSSLSQYSASQLQEFLSEGKISRSDLDAELARRNGGSGEQPETSSATGTTEEAAASAEKMME